MKLWLKILLTTGAVIVICLLVAGLLSGTLIRRRFESFVSAEQSAALQRLVPLLADYYQRNGSWDGLPQALSGRRGQGMGMGMGMSMGMGLRVIVLTPDYRVAADSQDELNGQPVSAAVWNSATPIVVGGSEVGRVTSGAGMTQVQRRTAQEQAFLSSLAWALLGAGVVGGIAAILVASGLALQITAPAKRLTQAARRIAAGKLEERVDITSHDELGEVSSAFNEMAGALQRQEELRRHMVADIAHELRNPLAVMQVDLESLQDGLTEPTPEVLASLREEVDMLSRLVEELRLLSLVDAGGLELQLQPVKLADEAQAALQQVGTAAERKGVRVEALLPADLPPAAADPSRLRQVLLNLLQNALRHTPQGGSVRVLAQNEGALLHLQVTDTGEGIAPQDLPHIFDRFYRADSSRARATGGSGLGLTISKALVEAMGGKIWAESVVGKGTMVHFTLPVG